MINQIYSSANKNVFTPLQSNGVNYTVSKPFLNIQKEKNEDNNEKKSSQLGYNIAKIALFSGLGILAIMKGVTKGGRHKVNKWLRFLEDRIFKLKNTKNKNTGQKLFYGILNLTRDVTKRSRTIFNIAPLKDAAVTHQLEKMPMLKRWSDKISDVFERISVMTAKRYYSKSTIKFQTMFAEFNSATKKMPKAEADKANAIINRLKVQLDSGFSETARSERLLEMKKDMSDIDKEAYKATYGNFNKFKKDALNGTFVSEALASHAKIKLNSEVTRLKSEISISPNDNYLATRKMLNNIYDFVDQSEETPRLIMRDLKREFSSYKKALENGAKAEDVFPETNVSKKLEELRTYFEKSKIYDKRTTKQVLQYIQNINSTLTNKNKTGEIQELMKIFKRSLSNNDFKKLNHKTNKTLRSWDKSIEMETDKLFDKIRDIKIGAAPVDVLGVLSSIGVVAYGLTKADNNDERISVSLKFGIPVIGAVITTLVCTVGLISAGPSLIIGLISGAAINKLGISVDNFRKRHQGKSVAKNEESLAQMGMDDLKATSKDIEKRSKLNIKSYKNKQTF